MVLGEGDSRILYIIERYNAAGLQGERHIFHNSHSFFFRKAANCIHPFPISLPLGKRGRRCG